jgi:hypothetical protein
VRELCDAAGSISYLGPLRVHDTITKCISIIGTETSVDSPSLTSTPWSPLFMQGNMGSAAGLACRANVPESPLSSPRETSVEEYVQCIGDITTWTAATSSSKKRRFASSFVLGGLC